MCSVLSAIWCVLWQEGGVEDKVLIEEIHHLYWVEVSGHESQLELPDHGGGQLGNRFQTCKNTHSPSSDSLRKLNTM